MISQDDIDAFSDAELLKLEHELSAAQEAVHILETGGLDKYGPHYLENYAYKRVVQFAKGNVTMCRYAIIMHGKSNDQGK